MGRDSYDSLQLRSHIFTRLPGREVVGVAGDRHLFHPVCECKFLQQEHRLPCIVMAPMLGMDGIADMPSIVEVLVMADSEIDDPYRRVGTLQGDVEMIGRYPILRRVARYGLYEMEIDFFSIDDGDFLFVSNQINLSYIKKIA